MYIHIISYIYTYDDNNSNNNNNDNDNIIYIYVILVYQDREGMGKAAELIAKCAAPRYMYVYETH